MIKKLAVVLIILIIILAFYLHFSEPGNVLINPDGKESTTLQKATPIPENIVSSVKPISPTPMESKENFRFIAMADSRGDNNGINLSVINKTFENIKKLNPQPEFAIMPGDLCDGAKTYSGVKSQLEYFKKAVTQYYPINFFYPGIGNHEIIAGVDGEKAFSEIFSEFKANFLEGYNKTAYFFDHGNTRFYMLNSDHPGEVNTISDKQMNWVKTKIDSTKKRNLFFMHDPAFPTGPHIGSSLDSNRFLRDKLWEMIDKTTLPMVFCGHEHFYSRRHINSDFNETTKGVSFRFNKSVYQLTLGSFGAPLYTEYKDKKNVDVPPISQYHYAVVDVSDSKIQITVYNLDGKLIDSFEQN